MKNAFFIIAIIILGACTTTRTQADIQAIRFGSGGGFTGEIQTYALSSEGRLTSFQQADTTLLKTIPGNQTKEILESAEGLRAIELNEPKNMYRFIEIDYRNSDSGRWVWGLQYQNLPEEIDAFYKKLTALTK